MATIIKTFTFSSGAIISASEHNTNFDTLYTLVNGNIDNGNIKTAAGIVYSKLALTGSIVLADLAAAIKSGSDSTVITGTKGTTNYVAKWNADGDLVDGYALIDDDTMATASATNIPSAESVKEYVDSNKGMSYELFTSNGTFNVPANVSKVFVTMVGGGGGGGGSNMNKTSGGGGGASLINYPYTVTPSGSVSVTRGAGGAGGSAASSNSGTGGGTTSFGTISVAGGSGGSGSASSAGGAGGSGPDAGTGSGGSNGIKGGNGGASTTGNPGWGGGGGSSFGTGGGSSGADGTGYGSGGAGADAGTDGGDGQNGFVLVQW